MLILPYFLFSQYSEKEIDSLMTKEVYRLRDENNIEEIAKLSKKVITASKKINYQKGKLYGYARLGNALCNLKNYKEGLKTLNYANHLADISGIKDNTIRASICIGIGRCYSESKTSYHNALIQFEKALYFAKKIKDTGEKDTYLFIIYGNFYSVYTNLGDEKKSAAYLWKVLKVKEESYAFYGLARYHNSYTKNSDSAKYYLEKAENYVHNDFERTQLYIQWGRYYEEKSTYDQAILNYKKAEDLAIKINEILMQDQALSGLYRTHKKMGNTQQAAEYSHKILLIKDSIINSQSKNTEIVIKDIVQKKEKSLYQKYSDTERRYYFFGNTALLILLFLGIKVYNNKKDNRKVQLLIEEKEEENQELQLKINESFDEVIKLAKENSPEFLTRFTEVYPQVINKLLELDSKLRVTELTLLAYIFLGFTTKDIANYTFKSTNTIRNRKFNLRKKLGIPGDDDMEIWIKALLGNPT